MFRFCSVFVQLVRFIVRDSGVCDYSGGQYPDIMLTLGTVEAAGLTGAKIVYRR